MTWDGVVTKFHKNYIRKLGISSEVEAYTQSIALQKTLELISLERRRGLEEDMKDYAIERAIDQLCNLPVVEC
jgi:hypothetical protein